MRNVPCLFLTALTTGTVLAQGVAPLDAVGPVDFSFTAPGGVIPSLDSNRDNKGISLFPLTMANPRIANIASLELVLTGLSHTEPSDLDIYLIIPFGTRTLEVMTDRGDQQSLVAVDLLFTDKAPGLPPENSLIARGLYLPEGVGGFGLFAGTSGGTDSWLLLVIDDSESDSGSLASFTLRGAVSSSSLLSVAPSTVDAIPTGGYTALTMPNHGTGTKPWSAAVDKGPFDFSFAAPGGVIPSLDSNGDNEGISLFPLTMDDPRIANIASLELVLTGLSHSEPSDLDIYLINPLGTRALEVMTDRGDRQSLVDVDLVFTDKALSLPPENSLIAPGLYLPEGVGGFGLFAGTSGGTDSWKLLIIDDSATDSGFLESFALRGTVVSPSLLGVAPLVRHVLPTSGWTSFAISNARTGTLNWSAAVTPGSPWLRITSGSFGVNSGTTYVGFDVNPNPASRTGIIRVSAPGAVPAFVDVQVVQAGNAAKPNVISQIPAPGATEVPLVPLIEARFDADLRASSVTGRTMQLFLDGPGGTVLREWQATVAYDAARRAVVLTPSPTDPLASGAQYRVVVSSLIVGADGTPVDPTSWTFSTIGAPGRERVFDAIIALNEEAISTLLQHRNEAAGNMRAGMATLWGDYWWDMRLVIAEVFVDAARTIVIPFPLSGEGARVSNGFRRLFASYFHVWPDLLEYGDMVEKGIRLGSEFSDHWSMLRDLGLRNTFPAPSEDECIN